MPGMLRNRVTPVGFVWPCLPLSVPAPPSGPGWLHEIKHDGFRVLIHRDGDRVHVYTRNGNDLTARFPAITAAAAVVRARSFWLDGEAVVVDEQGLASFDLLRRRVGQARAFCWAFDLIKLDGQDLREEPLECRKDALAKLLKRASFGLAVNEHHTGDGPALFSQACAMGLEGIVSKRAGSPYRSGRSPLWVKAKNPESVAARREAVEDWGRRR
jgi:bifunctional non-homologous end joining protein LigD